MDVCSNNGDYRNMKHTCRSCGEREKSDTAMYFYCKYHEAYVDKELMDKITREDCEGWKHGERK